MQQEELEIILRGGGKLLTLTQKKYGVTVPGILLREWSLTTPSPLYSSKSAGIPCFGRPRNESAVHQQRE